MDASEAIRKAVDNYWRDNQDSSHRYHLGGSIIGKDCAREVWYDFWWAYNKRHTGRLLRLFNRGHREEPHIVQCLRNIGISVWEADEHGNQFRISTLWGLYGGALDSILAGLEPYGLTGYGLLEAKTHGEKSFKALEDKGLLSSKLQHYVQMQIYMHYRKLRWGLYWAVNKNTDDLYIAIVHYRPEIALRYQARALAILQSSLPIPGISTDPSWWKCKMCDYREICHKDRLPDTNCRTCVNIQLQLHDDGLTHNWYCKRHHGNVPAEFMPQGCNDWQPRF